MPIHVDGLPNNRLLKGDSTTLNLLENFDDLGTLCEHLNDAYRLGAPFVSDRVYDQVFLAGLRQQQPNHPLLVHCRARAGKPHPAACAASEADALNSQSL